MSNDITEISKRMGKLETGQALLIGRIDGLSEQFGAAMQDMRNHNKTLDDHEVRLRLREVAYQERVLPALERLRNLEIKVAASAAVGGAMIAGIVELVRALTGG